jgi:hypothetical protein
MNPSPTPRAAMLIAGATLFLAALPVLACGDVQVATPEPTAAVAPPAPGDPAPAATPAAAAAPTGWNETCNAGSDRAFYCTTEKGKEVVVCVGTKQDPWIRYRFGPMGGAPELVFPDDQARSTDQFSLQERTYVQSAGTVLRFENAGVAYEITEMAGAGGRDGETNNFTGVYLLRDDKTIGTVKCYADLQTDWSKLSQFLTPIPG